MEENAAVNLANVDLPHRHLIQCLDPFCRFERQAEITGQEVSRAQRQDRQDLLRIKDGLGDGRDGAVSSSGHDDLGRTLSGASDAIWQGRLVVGVDRDAVAVFLECCSQHLCRVRPSRARARIEQEVVRGSRLHGSALTGKSNFPH
jgi:hypothetical protein